MALTTVRPQGMGFNTGRRNLVINGAMQVAQRGTSATGKTSSGYYTCDRFDVLLTNLGTWSFSQSTTVPSGEGFVNSFKAECTTADASPAAADQMAVQYHFEGQDLQQLSYGTSAAKSVTLSFWVRSSKTGTFIVNFLNKDNSRQNSQTYNVSAADTWQHVTITIDGDTSQGFDNDNGNSLEVNFYLGAGTDKTSGTLQDSWGANTAANRAVGQVNLADTANATWYITGVQLELGENASDFEHRSFGEELALCQRYAYMIGDPVNSGQRDIVNTGVAFGTTTAYAAIPFPCTMRTEPSLTVNNQTYFRLHSTSGGGLGVTAVAIDSGDTTERMAFINATSSGLTAGQGTLMVTSDASDNGGTLLFSAEL